MRVLNNQADFFIIPYLPSVTKLYFIGFLREKELLRKAFWRHILKSSGAFCVA